MAHLLPLLLGEGRGEVEKIESVSGCLWSLSQTPFSLPKQAQGVTGAQHSGEKLCCSGRKPIGNDWDKAGAVSQTVFFLRVWYDTLEGLFYLIAWLFFKACPGRAIFV
jgi:hypothetical protein